MRPDPSSLLRRIFLAMASVLLLTASSCTNAPDHPAASMLPEDKRPHDSLKLTIGIVYPMANSLYEMITTDAVEAAAAHDIQVIVKAPDEINLEQQIRMMETLITQQVDAIAIAPIDSEALTPMINKAVDHGIPVLCFESDAPGSKRFAYIGADNLLSGIRMGQEIDRLLKGKGMVLVETGKFQMRSLKERLEGFLRYVNEETDIQVLEVRYHEGNEERALSELEDMIDAHPHFDAFIALDILAGSTSILVWKAKGLNRYALTFGMMPEIREALRNGQITTTVSQNEEQWGSRMVDLLQQQLAGEEVQAFVDTGISLYAAEL